MAQTFGTSRLLYPIRPINDLTCLFVTGFSHNYMLSTLSEFGRIIPFSMR